MSRRRALTYVLGASLTLQACSVALDFDATSAKPAAEASGFCRAHASPAAIFCDDFDEEPLGTRWQAVEQSNGSAQNDSRAALSPPSSLLCIAKPTTQGENVRAVGKVAFPALTSAKVGLRVSFALRIDKYDQTSGAKNTVFDFSYGPAGEPNEIALNLVSTESAVTLQIAETSQQVGEGGAEYAPHGSFSIVPRLGEWLNVAIAIDVNDPEGQGNALRVDIDGYEQLDTSLMLPLKGGTPRLELGLGWVDTSMPSQTWAVRYDDFLVEAVRLD